MKKIYLFLIAVLVASTGLVCPQQPFQGAWSTNFGTLSIDYQSDGSVTGTYSYTGNNGGTVSGRISGRQLWSPSMEKIEGREMCGTYTLSGRFSESSGNASQSGNFELKMSYDYSSRVFKGWWSTDDGDGGEWNGTR